MNLGRSSSDSDGLPVSRRSHHFCGGALIRNSEEEGVWAVTAAHCMMQQ